MTLRPRVYRIAFVYVLALCVGCQDLGEAVRDTCHVDSDCIDAPGVLCLRIVAGDTFQDFCEHEAVRYGCHPDRSLLIGVPPVCDIDDDQDGIADVFVKDGFRPGVEEDECGSYGKTDFSSCGHLTVFLAVSCLVCRLREALNTVQPINDLVASVTGDRIAELGGLDELRRALKFESLPLVRLSPAHCFFVSVNVMNSDYE